MHLKIIYFVLLMAICLVPTIQAGASIKQIIDGGNYEYATTSATYVPTTPQTGLVPVNFSKYSNISAIYFEFVVGMDYSGVPDGSTGGVVQLYDNNNSKAVTGSEVSCGTTSYFRYRSSNLSYFWSYPNASVYAQVYAGSLTTVKLRAWRIIIMQNGGVSSTITYIPIGDQEAVSTMIDGIEIIYPKRWVYNSSNYDGTLSIKYCATIQKNTAGGMTAGLYDRTIDDFVSGGEVTTTNANETYLCTGALSLTDGDEYTTEAYRGTGTSKTGIIRNAFLVIEQTGMNITNGKTQMVMQMTNNYRLVSGTNYDIGNFLNQYNSSDWNNVTQDLKGEYIFKATTGYNVSVHLMNWTVAVSTEIPNSVLSTITTTYARYKTPSLTAPITSNIDDGIKANATSNEFITSTRLIQTLTCIGCPPSAPSNCWTYNTGTKLLSIPVGCLYSGNILI